MQSRYAEESAPSQERTYDLETIGKVTRLAEHLQSRDKDAWTANEIEAMGAEVGLKPEFIREALGKVEEERKTAPPKPKQKATPEELKAWRNAWWAGGWMSPLVLFGIANFLGFSSVTQGMGIFLGVPLYFGIGAYLTSIAKNAAKTGAPPFSRDDMLRTLEQYHSPALQTVLSFAPAGIDAQDGQIRTVLEWIRTTCRSFRCDGEMLTGPYFEAVFRSPADAAAAARAVQEGLARQPEHPSFRCGIATGPDPERARVEAEQLREAAEPGDILTDADSCGAALPVLDHLIELPVNVAGGNVYSWRGQRTP